MDVVLIDGSFGEGGGQILRTAVSLSALTGKPVKVTNIRRGREEPGLKPQHIAAVKAVADLCNAETSGLFEGSLEVFFHPQKIRGGKIKVDVGTAGSISLVSQALLPPSFFAGDKVVFEVSGGTDVRWSPPVDYLRNVMLPIIAKAGFRSSLELKRRGYFPAGGGRVSIKVDSIKEIKPFVLVYRGAIQSIKGLSFAHEELMKKNVAVRQAKSARTRIYNFVSNQGFNGDINISVEYSPADSFGCGITLWAQTEHSVLGASALGEKSRRAEEVGFEAADNLIREISSNAALDEYMGDQIIPYLALAGGRVGVSRITSHILTNIEVVNRFGFDVKAEGNIITCNRNLFQHP